MPIMLNTILVEAGLNPNDVRLIRHKDKKATKGRSPYELWRDNRTEFELYQSLQHFKKRKEFNAPYWMVFIVDLNDRTMFSGLYAVKNVNILEKDVHKPHMEGIYVAGSCDIYKLELQDVLSEFIGKLFINWGAGTLAWVQYAQRNNKVITELHEDFKEPEFPGFLNFIQPLSRLNKLPLGWVSILQFSRGVYLLTCPKTKEQYVGSATGENGFWGRWQDYIKNGHGKNVALKSREPSDYQVSILEVAGTSASKDDILEAEGRWQMKLQSYEMGLNRNKAKLIIHNNAG